MVWQKVHENVNYWFVLNVALVITQKEVIKDVICQWICNNATNNINNMYYGNNILGDKGEYGEQGPNGLPGYPGKPGEQGKLL